MFHLVEQVEFAIPAKYTRMEAGGPWIQDYGTQETDLDCEELIRNFPLRKIFEDREAEGTRHLP